MSWAKYDDGYDDSRKVRKALRHGVLGLAAIGLHTLGVTQSARRETDGLVDIDWLDEKLHRLSARERHRLMEVMTSVGFFEELPVGDQRTLRDTKGYEVTVGPLTEHAHLVHDFLDYNDSSAYMADKRRKDSDRKRPGFRLDSARIPPGIQTESAEIPTEPRARGRVPDPTRPDLSPPDPPQAGGKPAPPEGNRDRDKQRHRLELVAWAPHPNGSLDPALGDLWSEARARLGAAVTEPAFEQYLAGVHPHRFDGDTIVLGAPDASLPWIKERFGTSISSALEGAPIDFVPCEESTS